jgi:hypothetical protein
LQPMRPKPLMPTGTDMLEPSLAILCQARRLARAGRGKARGPRGGAGPRRSTRRLCGSGPSRSAITTERCRPPVQPITITRWAPGHVLRERVLEQRHHARRTFPGAVTAIRPGASSSSSSLPMLRRSIEAAGPVVSITESARSRIGSSSSVSRGCRRSRCPRARAGDRGFPGAGEPRDDHQVDEIRAVGAAALPLMSEVSPTSTLTDDGRPL